VKLCKKCGQEKPLSEFSKHPTAKLGVRPECKPCRAKDNGRWRDANREHTRAYFKRYYQENLEAERKRSREKMRAWRAANPEDAAEQSKKHCRLYYLRHKEKYETYRATYLNNKRGVDHQPYTRREIYERDGGVCRGCEQKLKFGPYGFHLDHIVPLSLKGPDVPANIQLLCVKCNCSKKAKLEGQIHLPV